MTSSRLTGCVDFQPKHTVLSRPSSMVSGPKMLLLRLKVGVAYDTKKLNMIKNVDRPLPRPRPPLLFLLLDSLIVLNHDIIGLI